MNSLQSQAMPQRANRRRRGVDEESEMKCPFLVVGGGIAGVSAAQELSRLNPSKTVTLLSQTEVLREVLFSNRLTEHLEELAVQESSASELKKKFPNIRVVIGHFNNLDVQAKAVVLSDQSRLHYDKVCICTGATPRVLWTHDNIITIRDTQSVENMSNLLQNAKRVVLLGNGGIALELAHELNFCETEWVVRDAYIGSPFFDATASDFLLEAEPRYDTKHNTSSAEGAEAASRDPKMTATASTGPPDPEHADSSLGSAVGPFLRKKLAEIPREHNKKSAPLHIHFEMQVTAMYDRVTDRWLEGLEQKATSAAVVSARSKLLAASSQRGKEAHRFAVFIHSAARTDDEQNEEKLLQCDFVVAALGVLPNHRGCEALRLDPEGSILVNGSMQTSDPHVYAAGDCCNYQRSDEHSVAQGNEAPTHTWMQMRLWAQARVMGLYAAQCINESQYSLLPRGPSTRNDWAFEMFAHCTQFFGLKVVLLGRFNGQGLGRESESAIKTVRVSKSKLIQSSARTHKNRGQRRSAKEDSKRAGVDFSQRKRGRSSGACACCEEGGVGPLGCLLTGSGPSRNGKEGGLREGASRSGVEVAIRYSPGQEYIKLVLEGGRVVGALLIGETDLEETFENLILNRIDVGHLGSQLLDPERDLEDYFD